MVMLRQLAPDEAALLNWLFAHWANGERFTVGQVVSIYDKLGLAFGVDLIPKAEQGLEDALRCLETIMICLASLHVAGLVDVDGADDDTSYRITALGHVFIRTCRPPKPK
jgi:hypothetical protein